MREDTYKYGSFSVIKWTPKGLDRDKGSWSLISVKASDFNLRDVIQDIESFSPSVSPNTVLSSQGTDRVLLRQDGQRDIVPFSPTEGFENPIFWYQKMRNGDYQKALQHDMDSMMTVKMAREHLTYVLENMVLEPGTRI